MYRNERLSRDIGKRVAGMTTREAVAEVKAYIGQKHQLHTEEDIMAYWDSLTDDEKVNAIQRALSS